MYIDGFLIPVPKKNVARYRTLARKAGKVYMDLGALAYHECIGDDLEPQGLATNFPKMMKAKKDETLIFAWIVFKSKAHRKQVNAKFLKDPRVQKMADPDNNPFDMKRMLYGGYKTLVRY